MAIRAQVGDTVQLIASGEQGVVDIMTQGTIGVLFPDGRHRTLYRSEVYVLPRPASGDLFHESEVTL